jgi:membrane protease YdiL (CAAX protease family)
MTEEVQDSVEMPVAAMVEKNASFAIAPWWHTAWVLATLMMWAVLAPGPSIASSSQAHWRVYLSMAMMQWVVLAATVSGIVHRREFFRSTLMRSARSGWIELGRGAGVYVAGLLVILVGAVIAREIGYQHHDDPHVFQAIVPSNWREVLLWGIVTVTIGFCEEHIVRGYVLQQLIGWGLGMRMTVGLASVFAAITSSLIFGSLHMYEGSFGAICIGCLGAVYAVAALKFGNLRAVILAHALQDFTAMVLSMSGGHSVR